MRPWKDRPIPQRVDCPNCGANVETEVLRGRVRWVTWAKVHIKQGTTSGVCYAVLKTEEHRERTA